MYQFLIDLRDDNFLNRPGVLKLMMYNIETRTHFGIVQKPKKKSCTIRTSRYVMSSLGFRQLTIFHY